MNFKETPVLVTGGAGFIGSHLVRRLVSLGAHVTVYDDFSAGKMENILDIAEWVSIIRADVRDYQTLKDAIKGKSVIFHLAAKASVPDSTKDPTLDFETNSHGTYNVLRAALELDSDAKIIYASTAAVYGEPQAIPIPENYPLNPVSPYGASKLTGEIYCKLFYRTYGIPTIAIRFFNVYGPVQPRYVMHDFLEKLLNNPKKLEVLGTGEQIRDFIYVTDAIDATLFITTKGCLYGDVINVGTGKGTKIRELAELTLKILGCSSEIFFTGETWKGDIMALVADVNKLRQLGFTHQVTLEEGYKRFIKSYLKTSSLTYRNLD